MKERWHEGGEVWREGWLVGSQRPWNEGERAKSRVESSFRAPFFDTTHFSGTFSFSVCSLPFVRSFVRSLARSFVRSFVGRAFSRRFFDTVPNRKRFSIRTWLAGDVATRRGAAAGDRLSLSGLDFDSRGQRTPARFYRIQSFALKGTRTSHLSPG